MPKVDIVHDEFGNVQSFAVQSDKKTGVRLPEGYKITTVEVPHDLRADEGAFLRAVHLHALQNAAKR